MKLMENENVPTDDGSHNQGAGHSHSERRVGGGSQIRNQRSPALKGNVNHWKSRQKEILIKGRDGYSPEGAIPGTAGLPLIRMHQTVIREMIVRVRLHR